MAYSQLGHGTPEGRAFEHAADPSVLIDHISQLKENVSQVSSSVGYTYFVRLSPADAQNDKQIQTALGISEANIVLEIEKAFVNLSLKANGKADLYFNAYFWQQYL